MIIDECYVLQNYVIKILHQLTFDEFYINFFVSKRAKNSDVEKVFGNFSRVIEEEDAGSDVKIQLSYWFSIT